MAHVRQQLRERVETLIKAAMGITNVFSFRIDPFDETELPAVNIATSQEDSSGATIDDGIDREVTLTITVVRRAVNGVGDSLDGDCVAIENAISNDSVMTTAAAQLIATDIDAEQGSQDIASVQLTYNVSLFGFTDPEATI